MMCNDGTAEDASALENLRAWTPSQDFEYILSFVRLSDLNSNYKISGTATQQNFD